MRHFTRFQLIGPVVVFAAALAAEAAALGLAHNPSSGWLWYLNLRVFGMFEQSHYVLDGATGIPASGLFFVALPTLCIAFIGLVLNRRFLLALASHSSLAYAVFLFVAWGITHPRNLGPSAQASLTLMQVPSGPNLLVLTMLFIGTFLSAWLSHVIYIRTIRSRT
jgi:hypothetical protein